ncbi:MAG: PhoX family phosphatase, partial [Actinomycetota bacterium]|nr:PhoX family phosphatase [Actinomycetota bacterium]
MPLSSADTVVVPKGYTATPFIPWGEPIIPGGPAFRGQANTPAEQAAQFGSGHDGIGYFPLGHGMAGDRHGILCLNHEYTTEGFFHPDDADRATRTAKSQAGHGVSVVEVRHRDGTWSVVADGGYNRRITATTPMTFSGPAAGHASLRTGDDPAGMNPRGTINNCGSGITPWGTYVTCEENFNGYFGSTKGAGFVPTAAQKRYGLSAGGFGYGWHESDPRFDLSAPGYENGHNRFGWQVEIDPQDPDAKPVKRTALGRFKHEDMATVIGRGNRAVAYMGDDERYDYIYKFVSDMPYQSYLRQGLSPFDEGVLYVAQFHSDGRGVWLPLVHGSGPLTAANGLSDQGDVLIRARMAADALGATPMDRPEWTTVAPDGCCYVTCTNNTRRTAEQVDAANPRAANKWGHIIRWHDSYDHVGVHFTWDVAVLAGPGGGVDGSTNAPSAAFGSPDGLWADPDGRLWIQTDGEQPEG